MGVNKNFTPQSSAPAVTAAASGGNWATYYTDLSGILKYVHPNTTVYTVGSFYPATGDRGAVSAVSGFFNAGAAVPVTGIFYGSTGVNPSVAPRILGEPSFWMPVVGPNGQLLSIPTYTRTG